MTRLPARGGRGRRQTRQGGNGGRALTNVVASTAPASNDNVTSNESGDLNTEMVDLKARCLDLEATCVTLRTLIEEGRSRMAGLTTHMNSQFEVMRHRMQQFVVLSEDRILSANPTSAGTTKIIALLENTDSGMKKVIRTTVRMHMFGMDGEVHASDDRVKNGSELFDIHYRILNLTCVQCC